MGFLFGSEPVVEFQACLIASFDVELAMMFAKDRREDCHASGIIGPDLPPAEPSAGAARESVPECWQGAVYTENVIQMRREVWMTSRPKI